MSQCSSLIRLWSSLIFLLRITRATSPPNSITAVPSLSSPPLFHECDVSYGRCSEFECGEAIDQLPVDHDGDAHYHWSTMTWTFPKFRRGGSNPRFALPHQSRYGNCVADVRLAADAAKDTSLWSLIRSREEQVLRDCVRKYGMGGFQTGGSNANIRISLWSVTNAPALNLSAVAVEEAPTGLTDQR